MEIKDKGGKAYRVEVLDKTMAEREWKAILDISNTIPGLVWSKEYLLAGKDEYRVYHGKWEHSLIVYNGEEVVGFLVAFEREPTGKVYKFPSFYIHFLALQKKYQGKGIGKALAELFFKKCRNGFKHLKGDVAVTAQTNSEDFNKSTQGFYKNLGFKRIGRKTYPNRVDWIMRLDL